MKYQILEKLPLIEGDWFHQKLIVESVFSKHPNLLYTFVDATTKFGFFFILLGLDLWSQMCSNMFI